MKNWLLSGFVVACLAILVFSHQQYQNKLDTIASSSTDVTDGFSEDSGEGDNKHSTDDSSEVGDSEISSDSLVSEILEGEDTLRVAIFGSDALGGDHTYAWPHLLEEHLLEWLGDNQVELTTTEVDLVASSTIVHADFVSELLESEPNLLIIEPLVLNNVRVFGTIDVQETLNDLHELIQLIDAQAPDLTVVVTPSNPIHNPTTYDQDIAALEAFAASENYLYANHWQAWPDPHADEMKDYLSEGRPNEAGHQVWAEYIFDYLTRE
ncbi:SGNH/GDSL hydrolase family protein [Alkalihalobacillus pseudalcaliphilus]|uniref:SGNH/GDSL hydrolase family protein n=1 Tax=Alkalihalobacillus pseudalcaliphilus TaxID=79884 RepID=UPI00064DE0BD|nr:SGNH/GDSL hydrolase family protein [Alkalihalobacillus pseudalcaliphilus]KMK78295.1 hypothetical protein AB990_02370 [Alkalihalobacillus pseudalcaliphilus]